MLTHKSVSLFVILVFGSAATADASQLIVDSYGLAEVARSGGLVFAAKLVAMDNARRMFRVGIEEIFGVDARSIEIVDYRTQTEPNGCVAWDVVGLDVAIGNEIELRNNEEAIFDEPDVSPIIERLNGSVPISDFAVGDRLLVVCRDRSPCGYLPYTDSNVRRTKTFFGRTTPESFLRQAPTETLAADMVNADLHMPAVDELRRRGRFDAETILLHLPLKADRIDDYNHHIFYYRTLLRSDLEVHEVTAFLRSAKDYFHTGVQPESLTVLIADVLDFLKYSEDHEVVAAYGSHLYDLGKLISWNTDEARDAAQDLFRDVEWIIEDHKVGNIPRRMFSSIMAAQLAVRKDANDFPYVFTLFRRELEPSDMALLVGDLVRVLPHSDHAVSDVGVKPIDRRLVSLIRELVMEVDDAGMADHVEAVYRILGPEKPGEDWETVDIGEGRSISASIQSERLYPSSVELDIVVMARHVAATYSKTSGRMNRLLDEIDALYYLPENFDTAVGY